MARRRVVSHFGHQTLWLPEGLDQRHPFAPSWGNDERYVSTDLSRYEQRQPAILPALFGQMEDNPACKSAGGFALTHDFGCRKAIPETDPPQEKRWSAGRSH